MNRHWLIIWNCQFQGLGNCLSLLVDGLRLNVHEMNEFLKDEDRFMAVLDDFEHVIIHPRLLQMARSDLGSHANVTVAPSIAFSGYHPDLTYVLLDGKPVRGPLHDYHSALVVTAYKLGLSEADALGLFDAALYRRLGYLDRWAAERDALLSSFEAHGIDLRADFVRWSRQGPFMHSVNHPRIHVLMDVARRLAVKLAGPDIYDTEILPPDNLVGGPVFPIFPEIAERLGAGRGSYLFKPHTGYNLIDLKTFVSGSFAAYRAYPPQSLTAKGPAFERTVKAYVEGA